MHDMARFAHANVPAGEGMVGSQDLLAQASIEVTPKTAAKVATFRDLLPEGRRVYIANLAGNGDDIVETAKRLSNEGMAPMPHIVARSLKDATSLDRLLGRLSGEAGVHQALVLAGNTHRPIGAFGGAMDLVRTGLFDKHKFGRLHFAAHPEGNPALSPALLQSALLSKAAFARDTDADVALVTQFLFDGRSLLEWLRHLDGMGTDLPVHVGICGPTAPHTLLNFAISCGVGNSMKVLRNQMRNVWTLAKPYVPNEFLSEFAAAAPTLNNFAGFHVFPFGGVEKTCRWMGRREEPGAA